MGKDKMILRLTESELSSLVTSAVRRVMRINEGTTDQRVWETLEDLGNSMSGSEVVDTLFNWLDSDTLYKLAKWAIQDGYVRDTHGLLGSDDEDWDEEY